MFRQSHMNQSRLPQRTAVYSQGDKQHQSLATPAPYILPSDICEPHTHTSTHKRLTLPCHTLPISNAFHHHVFQGCSTQYAWPPWHLYLPFCSYGEALVSNEKEPINSNQSKWDYEVNYLYSHLG